VVEAPQSSGALITARFAAEHGKAVLSVPGHIDRPSSAGTNALIRDGAVPITSVEDILFELKIISGTLLQPALDLVDPNAEAGSRHGQHQMRAAPTPLPANLPEPQRKLMALLTQTPQHIDSLAQEAGMSAMQAGVEITLLELAGLSRRLPGNTYVRAIT
jgi:DNA processing protein